MTTAADIDFDALEKMAGAMTPGRRRAIDRTVGVLLKRRWGSAINTIEPIATMRPADAAMAAALDQETVIVLLALARRTVEAEANAARCRRDAEGVQSKMLADLRERIAERDRADARAESAERDRDAARRMLARVYDQLRIIPHQRADVLASEIAEYAAIRTPYPTALPVLTREVLHGPPPRPPLDPALFAVLRATLDLRRAESEPVPGDSIAELEANVPAAQRQTMVALTKWRGVMDEHMPALMAALGEST